MIPTADGPTVPEIEEFLGRMRDRAAESRLLNRRDRIGLAVGAGAGIGIIVASSLLHGPSWTTSAAVAVMVVVGQTISHWGSRRDRAELAKAGLRCGSCHALLFTPRLWGTRGVAELQSVGAGVCPKCFAALAIPGGIVLDPSAADRRLIP